MCWSNPPGKVGMDPGLRYDCEYMGHLALSYVTRDTPEAALIGRWWEHMIAKIHCGH